MIFLSLLMSLNLCKKEEDENVNFYNSSIDTVLVGAWFRSYSGRDFHNGITVCADTIRFNSDNSGSRSTFSFSEMFNFFCFQFYTEDNFIILRPEGVKDARRLDYFIHNDSLFIPEFGIPYVKSIND